MALGGLIVRLSLSYAEYVQGLDKSSQEALKFAKYAQDAMDRAKRATSDFLGGVVTGAVAAVASYQTVEAAIRGVADAINRMDALNDMSARTGIATKTLQELAYAGQFADVSLESIGVAAKKLSQTMVEAASGGKEQAKVFRAIGVEIKNADGTLRNVADVMEDVSAVFADLDDGAAKTALSVKLFGKSGADLIPLLNGGREELTKMREEAHRFGQVLDNESIQSAAAFNDNIDKLGKIFQGTFNQIASGVLPVLKLVSDAMVDAATDTDSLNAASQRLARDGSITSWATETVKALSYVLDVGEGIGRFFKGLGELIGGMAAAGISNLTALGAAFAKLQTGNLSGAMAELRGGWERMKSIAGNVGSDLADTFGDQTLGQKIRARLDQMRVLGNTVGEVGKKTRDAKSILDALGDSDGPKKAEDAMKKLLAEAQKLADLRNKENADIDAYLRAEEERRLQSARSAEEAASKAEFELQTRGMLRSEIEETILARMEENLWTKRQGTDAYEAATREIEARKRVIAAYKEGEARDRQEDAARVARERALAEQAEWARMMDQIGQSLSDALMEGGRSARDYLKGLFKNLVLRPLLQPLMAPVSAFLASITGSAGAMAAGADGGTGMLGQLGTLASLGSAAQKAWAWYTGGGSGTLSGSLSGMYGEFARSSVGQYFGLSEGAAVVGNNPSAYVAPQMTATGSTVGTVAGAVGGIVAGHYLGRGISGGYSAFGSGSGNSAVNTGTAIGAVVGSIIPVIGTAVGAAVGGVIGGLVNRAFGRKAPEIMEEGITGSFAGGAFTGQAYADIREKGGWFRSDKNYTQFAELNAEIDKALDQGGRELLAHVTKYTDALGLPASQMQTVTEQFKVKITGDADADSKAIAEALGKYSDALLGAFTDEVEPFRRAGETVAQAIERVGTALVTVNGALEQLGFDQLAASLAGGDAASQLAGMFGGPDGFQQAAGAFYQAFYTEQERVDALLVQLTETFEDFGLVMPDVTGGVDQAHQAYRDLLAAQDLTTESGRQTFAALLGLSGAFDAVLQSTQELTTVEDERADAIRNQGLDLQLELLRATGREQEAVNLQRQQELAVLRELDPALAQVKESIYAAIDAAAEAANVSRVRTGVNSILEDFFQGPELQAAYAHEVQRILREGGFGEVPIDRIMGVTKEEVVEWFRGLGIEDQQTVLDAYNGGWKRLQELIHGTSDAIREAIEAYRGGSLADAIESATMATLTPDQQRARLTARAASLREDIATGDDPVGAAQELQDVLTQIIGLENQAADERLASLAQEIEGRKKLKAFAQDLFQYVGNLRIGELSPYGSAAQVGFAEEAFQDALSRARNGDTSGLLGSASAYLSEASDRYASGPQFAAIFDNVTDTLEALGVSLDTDPQLDLLQQQYDELEAIKDNGKDLLDALLSIDALLGGRVGETIAAAEDDEIAAAGGTTETTITASGSVAEVTGGTTQGQANAGVLEQVRVLLATIAEQTKPIRELADTAEMHKGVSLAGHGETVQQLRTLVTAAGAAELQARRLDS
jgi:hypothetical protein